MELDHQQNVPTMTEREFKVHLNNNTTIEALPLEILIKILQRLPHIDRLRVERVCRKWRDASRKSWNDIETLHIVGDNEIRYHQRFKVSVNLHEFVVTENNKLYIGTDDLRVIHSSVLRIGAFLKRLTFRNYTSKNYTHILSIITKYCRNIDTVKLDTNSCDRQALGRFLEVNTKLHSIKLEDSADILAILPIRNWKSLRLMVLNCDELWEEKIVSLIKSSESLEEFQTYYWSMNIAAAVAECKDLKTLHFTPCDYGPSLQWLFDASMLNSLTTLRIEVDIFNQDLLNDLLKQCSNLECLSLNYEDVELPAEVKETILALPMLETLEIDNWMIDDDFLTRLTRIKHLFVVVSDLEVTEMGLIEMIKNSKHLETLGLTTHKLTDEFFKKLVKETTERSKILKIIVHGKLYKNASELCMKSKIQIVQNVDFLK